MCTRSEPVRSATAKAGAARTRRAGPPQGRSLARGAPDAVPRSGAALSMQSYRFLRAVMNTAVRDGAVMKNPCQIAGAGSDRAKERPVASPAEVVTLLEAITPRYRAAVLLAAWCGLRCGEIIGLRLEDVNVGSATVTVRRNRVELLENDRAA